MKIWITRPYAYEVNMGGWRSCKLHIVKPFYDHRTRYDDFMDRLEEYGWYYGNHTGVSYVKDFLKQDKELMSKVWLLIFESVSPKEETDIPWEIWYDNLFSDDEWELKCKINYKRTLIEVDLYSKTCYLVKPEVYYDDNEARIETLDIPDELALLTNYPFPEEERGQLIPF